MECVCSQTRHRFLPRKSLGFWENGVKNHVNTQGKSRLPEKQSPQRRIEPTTLHQVGQRTQHTTNELCRPPICASNGPSVDFVSLAALKVWHGQRTRTPPRCLLVGCLTSQQHATVFQGRICSDNFTRCHTETEVADQTFHLTKSQYTDTGPTSPIAGPITPGAWQGSHWSTNY